MGLAIGDRRWKEYRWRKRKRGWLAESEEHAARGDEITIYRVVNFKCATEKKYNNQSGGECHRLAVLVTGVHSGRGPPPSEVEAYEETQQSIAQEYTGQQSIVQEYTGRVHRRWRHRRNRGYVPERAIGAADYAQQRPLVKVIGG
mmetsp:Transcript_33829/g.62168  ORF Transcript_33829/g.62168 Transcript_33829/m.62168 type:complete len:145 (-) Transcript_33829:112-546(-)